MLNTEVCKKKRALTQKKEPYSIIILSNLKL